nr:hypothetical protein [Tanacetum cinerariifolium]
MAKSSSKNEVFDNSLCSKDCKKNTETLNSKITKISDKHADKRSDKIKDVLGYNVVPPPIAQLYISLKKDLSWTGLPECADNTVTDYSRPSPTVESTSGDYQNKNSSASENGESTDSILSKPAVKFVKAAKRSTSNKVEAVKKPSVSYAELYRKPSKKSTVRGNQRNWNNLKVQRLERELKARTPIHKVDRGRSRPVMAWVPKKFLTTVKEMKKQLEVEMQSLNYDNNKEALYADLLGLIVPEQVVIKNPKKSSNKESKRRKSATEIVKAKKKPRTTRKVPFKHRTCSKCGEKGHNKRKCTGKKVMKEDEIHDVDEVYESNEDTASGEDNSSDEDTSVDVESDED